MLARKLHLVNQEDLWWPRKTITTKLIMDIKLQKLATKETSSSHRKAWTLRYRQQTKTQQGGLWNSKNQSRQLWVQFHRTSKQPWITHLISLRKMVVSSTPSDKRTDRCVVRYSSCSPKSWLSLNGKSLSWSKSSLSYPRAVVIRSCRISKAMNSWTTRLGDRAKLSNLISIPSLL